MNSNNLTYQNLTPECQLDALASIGIYPETGLLALNSYENRVYSFSDENQLRYVVKFYRPQRWSEQQILEEHEFTERLLQAGLNLSSALNIHGKTLQQFAGYYFSLFENLSARTLEVDDIDSLYDVGVALGKLHKIGAKHTFSTRPTLDIKTTIREASASLMHCAFIPSAVKVPLFDVIANIQSKLANVNDSTLAMIAIHGDAHASNILLKEQQPHWVDFDDCKMGPAIQDIWMLLHGNREEQQLQLAMILEGYQEEYDFDCKQLQQIQALRTMRIINYASWINNRWADPAFSRNFTWFTTDQYWKELLQSLQLQLTLLDEAPLALQPQY